MENKYTIIDVRTPEEYATGHIEGSINIPIENLINQLEDFEDMQQPLFLYCHSGNRSGQAVGILQSAISGIQATNIGGLEEATEFCKKLGSI